MILKKSNLIKLLHAHLLGSLKQLLQNVKLVQIKYQIFKTFHWI